MRKASRPDEIVTEYARTLIRVKAKQLVRRPDFSRSDQDDVEQDLVLHLLSQAEHFDPARGSLNTFISRVVDSAVAMLVRGRGRIKRGPVSGVKIQSLELKVEQADGPPAPLWKTISIADLERRAGGASLSDAELYELVEGVASVIALMSPELRDVCRSLLERNRTETECELGLSRRGYETAMEQIRQHFARGGLAKS
jgi:DNA-directed RNA polymerase specialized sigma24 family protein